MSELQDSMVPPVLDALVVLAKAAVSHDPKFEVLDGPTHDMQTRQKFVLLGWSGQPDTRGIEAPLADGGPGGRQVEPIDVHGVVQVQLAASRAATQKAARDQAFAVLNNLARAVKAENTKRPPFGVAQVSRAALRQQAVEPYVGAGGGCAVHFTIHIEGTR